MAQGEEGGVSGEDVSIVFGVHTQKVEAAFARLDELATKARSLKPSVTFTPIFKDINALSKKLGEDISKALNGTEIKVSASLQQGAIGSLQSQLSRHTFKIKVEADLQGMGGASSPAAAFNRVSLSSPAVMRQIEEMRRTIAGSDVNQTGAQMMARIPGQGAGYAPKRPSGSPGNPWPDLPPAYNAPTAFQIKEKEEAAKRARKNKIVYRQPSGAMTDYSITQSMGLAQSLTSIDDRYAKLYGTQQNRFGDYDRNDPILRQSRLAAEMAKDHEAQSRRAGYSMGRFDPSVAWQDANRPAAAIAPVLTPPSAVSNRARDDYAAQIAQRVRAQGLLAGVSRMDTGASSPLNWNDDQMAAAGFSMPVRFNQAQGYGPGNANLNSGFQGMSSAVTSYNPQQMQQAAANNFAQTFRSKVLGGLLKFNSGVSEAMEQRIQQLQGEARRHYFTGQTLMHSFTLPAAMIAGGGVALGAQFEDRMMKVAAQTQVKKEEIPGLSRQILGMSTQETTSRGPIELAEGLREAASAGYSGQDAMKVLKVSAQGATAQFGETKVITDTLTSALGAYGEGADKAAHYGDVLAKAINLGKGEANQYAPALGKVVGQASLLGVSFEEISASMATMTRIGISPDIGATSLNNLLLHITNPTKKGTDQIANLGLSAEKLRAKISGPQGLAGTLTELFALSQKKGAPIDILGDIVGDTRGLRAMLATTGPAVEQVYADILKGVNNAHGEMNRAATVMADTFGAQWQRMLNVGQGVVLKLTQQHLPALTAKMKSTADAIPGIVARAQAAWKDLGPLQNVATAGAVGLLASGPLFHGLALAKDVRAGAIQAGGFMRSNPLAMAGAAAAGTMVLSNQTGALGDAARGVTGAFSGWGDKITLATVAAQGLMLVLAGMQGAKSAGGIQAMLAGIGPAIAARATLAKSMAQTASIALGGGSAAGISAGQMALPGMAGMAGGRLANLGKLAGLGAPAGLAGMAGIGLSGAAIGAGLVLGPAYRNQVQRHADQSDVWQHNLGINSERIDRSFGKMGDAASGNDRAEGFVEKFRLKVQQAGDDVTALDRLTREFTDSKKDIKYLNLAPESRQALELQIEEMKRAIESRKIQLSVEVPPNAWEGFKKDFMSMSADIANANWNPFKWLGKIGDAAAAGATGGPGGRRQSYGFDSAVPVLGSGSVAQAPAPRRTFRNLAVEDDPVLEVEKDQDTKEMTYKQWVDLIADSRGRINQGTVLDPAESARLKNALKYKQAADAARTKAAGAEVVPAEPTGPSPAQLAAQEAQIKGIEGKQDSLRKLASSYNSFSGVLDGIMGRIREFAKQSEMARTINAMHSKAVDGVSESYKRQAIAVAAIYDRMKQLSDFQSARRDFFSGVQQNLMQQGIDPNIARPFAAAADKQSGGFAQQMRALQDSALGMGGSLAQGAQDKADRLNQEINNLAAQIGALRDTLRGDYKEAGIGGKPVEGGPIDNSSFSGTPINAVINRALNTPMGTMACARFVNKAFTTLGIGFKGSENARTMEAQVARVAKRIPVSQAGVGDLLVGPGGGPSGRHVGIGVGNGMFAAKNRDRHARLSSGDWDGAYDTSALARGGVQIKHSQAAMHRGSSGKFYGARPAPTTTRSAAVQRGELSADRFSDAEHSSLQSNSDWLKFIGGPVDDTPYTQNRLALARAISNKKVQEEFRKVAKSKVGLREMSRAGINRGMKAGGKGLQGAAEDDWIVAQLGHWNQFATTADVRGKDVQQGKAYYGFQQDAMRRNAMIGQEGDPIAALSASFKGDNAPSPFYQSAMRRRELGIFQRKGMADSETSKRAAAGRMGVLQAGAGYLQGEGATDVGYQRVLETEQKRVEVNEKLRDLRKYFPQWAAREAASEMQSFHAERKITQENQSQLGFMSRMREVSDQLADASARTGMARRGMGAGAIGVEMARRTAERDALRSEDAAGTERALGLYRAGQIGNAAGAIAQADLEGGNVARFAADTKALERSMKALGDSTGLSARSMEMFDDEASAGLDPLKQMDNLLKSIRQSTAERNLGLDLEFSKIGARNPMEELAAEHRVISDAQRGNLGAEAFALAEQGRAEEMARVGRNVNAGHANDVVRGGNDRLTQLRQQMQMTVALTDEQRVEAMLQEQRNDAAAKHLELSKETEEVLRAQAREQVASEKSMARMGRSTKAINEMMGSTEGAIKGILDGTSKNPIGDILGGMREAMNGMIAGNLNASLWDKIGPKMGGLFGIGPKMPTGPASFGGGGNNGNFQLSGSSYFQDLMNNIPGFAGGTLGGMTGAASGAMGGGGGLLGTLLGGSPGQGQMDMAVSSVTINAAVVNVNGGGGGLGGSVAPLASKLGGSTKPTKDQFLKGAGFALLAGVAR